MAWKRATIVEGVTHAVKALFDNIEEGIEEALTLAPRPKALGEVEGAVTPNLSEGNIFELTVKGATTLEKPTNWPAAYSEQLVILKQKPESHAVTLGAGITLVGGPINAEPNAVSVLNLISQDGGATVYALNAVEGKEGLRGLTGLTPWAAIAPWESGKAYVPGPPASLVTNAGSTFVCLGAVTSATPPGEDPTHWAKVAEKGAVGATGAQGPPGATGATKALGNVSGTVKLDLSKALVFTMTATGNLTIEFEHWPEGASEPELYILQDATGGRTIAIPGVIWNPEPAPEFVTSPNAVNIVPLASPDGGTTVYGIKGLQGKEGPKGTTGNVGATGPTGSGGTGAYSGLILPYHSNNLKISTTAALAVANKAWFVLCIVEKTGKLKNVLVYNGATINGETRVAAFDTGQGVATKFHLLGQSAAAAQTGAGAWQSFAIPAEPNVVAGAHILLALMNSGTTGLYGCGPAITASGSASLPEGTLPGFAGTLKGKQPILGTVAFAELAFADVEHENILTPSLTIAPQVIGVVA